MTKIILKFGITAGLIISVLMVASLSFHDSLGMGTLEILGYISMLIAFSTVFIGIKAYRDKHLGGAISFGKGFKVGILITLIASLLYVLMWIIYSNTVATDFMDNYQQYYIEELKDQGLSEQELNAQIAEMDEAMEMYKHPVFQLVITFLEIFPVGLLVTLISSFVLMRKTKKTDQISDQVVD